MCLVISVMSDSVWPSPPGFSVHGILQAGILEWVALPSSRASSQPRDQTRVSCISCIGDGFFTAVKGICPFTLSLSPPRKSHTFWYFNACDSSLGTKVSSDQISRSVVSDSLWPHESQHARPPCPSPTPGVHPDSHPLSQWCHPAISSSVIPFSSCPQSLPASESFPMSQLFTWGGQSTGVSALASFLPKVS